MSGIGRNITGLSAKKRARVGELWGVQVNFSQSKDERLLAFYDGVRQQVEIDRRAGNRYRFAGEGVKRYAEQLRKEMDRRRLNYNRINWE